MDDKTKQPKKKKLLLFDSGRRQEAWKAFRFDVQLLFSNQRGENKIEEGSVKQPPSGRHIKSQAWQIYHTATALCGRLSASPPP